MALTNLSNGMELPGIFTNFKPWDGQSGLLVDLILALGSEIQTLKIHSKSINIDANIDIVDLIMDSRKEEIGSNEEKNQIKTAMKMMKIFMCLW